MNPTPMQGVLVMTSVLMVRALLTNVVSIAFVMERSLTLIAVDRAMDVYGTNSVSMTPTVHREPVSRDDVPVN